LPLGLVLMLAVLHGGRISEGLLQGLC
jgi:hypothetical protein